MKHYQNFNLRTPLWNLPPSFENTYTLINKTVHDQSFKEKHRLSDTAFTRDRTLKFSTLFLYLLNLRKHSNQVELDQFFKVICDKKEAAQHVTKSAFSQARLQFSSTAFIDVNHQFIEHIYKSQLHYKTWKGFRLCAIDGTSIRLPNEPNITEHFGVQKGKANQSDCAIGMASVFYDILNHQVIDSTIQPNNTSEKKCAAEHLQHSKDNDLIIYDRGYPGFWLYALHTKLKRKFCMRAKTNQCLLVKEFINSNKKQAVVTYYPNKSSIKTCEENNLSTAPITLRLIRVDLPSGVEVLISNLMDTVEYNAGLFKSLYHQRWGIEENYKRLKQWLEIENFSGKSALSVQQDFYAKILASNLTALMSMAAQIVVNSKTEHRKLSYQINFSQAASKMKHKIVCLILHAGTGIMQLIKQMIGYISKTIEAVREGRSAPRPLKNIKNDIHYSAYKSAL